MQGQYGYVLHVGANTLVWRPLWSHSEHTKRKDLVSTSHTLLRLIGKLPDAPYSYQMGVWMMQESNRYTEYKYMGPYLLPS